MYQTSMIRPVYFLAIFLCTLATNQASAQQFRIETQIYVGDATAPVSENTTLFDNDLVFDVQNQGSQTHEATILAPKRRQIVLLDRARGIKLELDELQLIKIADLMRKQASTNKATKFLTEERFTESINLDAGRATLTSESIKYTVMGQRPADVRMLPKYNQFIDYFTRLKFSDPHALPPFPRMRLNQTLSKLGWIPSEVAIVMDKNMMVKEGLNARSKHTLVPNLSQKDQTLISALKTDWLNYKSVSLDHYRGLGERIAKQ